MLLYPDPIASQGPGLILLSAIETTVSESLPHFFLLVLFFFFFIFLYPEVAMRPVPLAMPVPFQDTLLGIFVWCAACSLPISVILIVVYTVWERK